MTRRESPVLNEEAFQALTNVSRETLKRLRAYVAVLEHWQMRINLVSAASLADVWHRHILDCAQLAELASAAPARWVDLGSGAGLPGLVVAILRPEIDMHLIESDARKAAFLAEAARTTATPVGIHAGRIETAEPLSADVVAARACAPLTDLVPHFLRHRSAQGVGLFLKGKTLKSELTLAHATWTLDYDVHPSRTGSGGQILRLRSADPINGLTSR